MDSLLIDELYRSNIHEDALNEAFKDTNIETHMKNMLDKVEDQDLKSNLENVVYKYTSVFSTESSAKAALVEPYKIGTPW